MSTGLPAPKRVDIGAMRERYGLTQGDIADYLHVDVRTIRRWERGTASPSPMAMAHIRSLQRQLSGERDDHRRGGGVPGGDAPQPNAAPASLLPGQGPEAGAAMPRRRLPSL